MQTFQKRIGYRFNDQKLLQHALTHSSFVNEHPEAGPDNQRLEFLGDAVLGFITAGWIFERFPDFKEGEMTRLRAALVRAETLARFSAQLALGEVLRLGHGEESGGGRCRAANLGDAFEALVGALYLDGGVESVQRLLCPLIEPAAETILAFEADKDVKSNLQEWAQAVTGITPRYRIVNESGPDHAKIFTAEVLVGHDVFGQGQGRSKQAAERAAAREALKTYLNQPD
ncbi:MAG: ribonuclease III [Anaerolineae bacterium]|nr:ribonuclease III [Anaerolineae bacterium]